MEDVFEKTARYVMNTYPRLPIAFQRGKGVRIWDVNGREYLDFVGGIAVNSLGHCHPKVVEAICQQASELMHCSNLYFIQRQAELAEALISGTPFGKAFFCNSGAEANEGAIKLARKYAKTKLGEDKFEIITALDSFHGRTLATVTATGQPKYQKGFEPLPAGFKYVPFNDLRALEEAISEATCAVMLEPIQGESGVRVATYDYLRGVRRVCEERGLLLILDEVQTGLGRTGKMFAFEHYGIEPDIVTLAKSLGGGIPIGALLAKDDVASAFQPGNHASTFGGNPLACAAGLAVLKVLREDGLVERARIMGEYFMGRLEELRSEFPHVKEVRGKGLMVGLGLEGRAKDVALKCMEKGLLVNSIGDSTLRFLPPFIITKEDVDLAVCILKDSMREVYGPPV